eukprot:gb/GEZN01014566.1/.p1 GENE.gb/GEZN01014566.1/~~gb/GEZN01014566.1/.p1  ORF type:complete len:242 (-),score=20.14 gb/GEZN01014566.1/:218-943(-)
MSTPNTAKSIQANEAVCIYTAGIEAEERGDDEAAFKLFLLAGRMGDPHGQHAVALAYQYGRGINVSIQDAVKWYRKAVAQSFEDSEYNLGCLTSQGLGVPYDPKEAFRLWLLSAQHGKVKAMYSVASCYLDGEGHVHPDPVLGIDWLKKAAKKGHMGAQHRLGQEYLKGQFIAQDPKAGKKWMKKAAAQGSGPARMDLSTIVSQERFNPRSTYSAKKNRRGASRRCGLVRCSKRSNTKGFL